MIKNYSKKLLRFKGERLSLLFVLIILILLVSILFKVSIYVMIGSVILGLFYVRLLQAQQLGNSLQISQFQFPQIYEEATDCARILGIKKMPKIYITQDPVMNAYTMGFKSPYTIVLNSGLVENMSLDELRVVIGHEMGHAKFKHTLLLSLMSPIGKQVAFIDLLFGFWGRKTEYTCDRCALVCSKKSEDVLRTLIKIAAGSKIGRSVDLEKLSLQLQDAKALKMDRAGELLGSHPYILKRIWEINKFAYQYNHKPCENCGNISSREANFCWACKNKLTI